MTPEQKAAFFAEVEAQHEAQRADDDRAIATAQSNERYARGQQRARGRALLIYPAVAVVLAGAGFVLPSPIRGLVWIVALALAIMWVRTAIRWAVGQVTSGN